MKRIKEVFIGEGKKETVEQKTTRKNEERKSSKVKKKKLEIIISKNK